MIKQFAKALIPTVVWSKMRVLKLRRSVNHFKSYQTKRNISGHQFLIKIADPLASGWYGQDWEQLPEVEFLKKYTLKPGAKVFDLGAHQGVVAMVLGKEVAPNGKVIALEANKHNAAVANENVVINNSQGIVKIMHAAISNEIGELVFSESLNGKVDDGKGEWGQVITPAVTIDHLCKLHGRPDLIFIDVEGFEMNALAGSKETFDSIPSWFIEVHSDYQLQSFGCTPEQILEKFPSSVYKKFIANDTHKAFVPLIDGSAEHKEMIQKRFFLIAIKN